MTLFASVYCNRYNAMEVFDQMLQQIKDDEEAVAVSEMLKENQNYYENISDRVPASKLHPIIQHLQKELQQKIETEKNDRLKELDEW